MISRKEHLEAERNFLKDRLAEMPAGNKLTRLSAESRIREIEEELALDIDKRGA